MVILFDENGNTKRAIIQKEHKYKWILGNHDFVSLKDARTYAEKILKGEK